jgi:sulfite oxidase
VGARQVKWASRIQLSAEEALSPWQRGAPYKGFASAVKSFKDVDTRSMVSIQSLPVMSAITAPQEGAAVPVFDCPDNVAQELRAHINAARPVALRPSAETYSAPAQCIEARGWAYSGDGNGIVRVDATSDNGLTWVTADIERGPTREEMEARQAWAWSLWSAAVPVPSGWKAGDRVEVAVKAMDSGFNQQPERARDVWNKRGVLNTTWHRVRYTLKADEEDDE